MTANRRNPQWTVVPLVYKTGMETVSIEKNHLKNKWFFLVTIHFMAVLTCSRPSKACKRLQTECLGLEVEEKVWTETTFCRNLPCTWRSEEAAQDSDCKYLDRVSYSDYLIFEPPHPKKKKNLNCSTDCKEGQKYCEEESETVLTNAPRIGICSP